MSAMPPGRDNQGRCETCGSGPECHHVNGCAYELGLARLLRAVTGDVDFTVDDHLCVIAEGMPRADEDPIAKMLGVSHVGCCPRCGEAIGPFPTTQPAVPVVPSDGGGL